MIDQHNRFPVLVGTKIKATEQNSILQILKNTA
jgi:hypothetical protein